MYDLKDKVVLITGAATGIGRAISEILLKEGIKGITIADFNAEEGTKAVIALAKLYGANKVQFVECDVLVDEQIEVAFEKTVAYFKQLDIVINNAGIFNELQVKRCIGINLTAVIIATQLAIEIYLPKYRSTAEGIVLNTASILGHAAIPIAPTYTATKHALVGLAKCYGTPSEYKKTCCRVMNLCPGFTETTLLNEEFFVVRAQHEQEKQDMLPLVAIQQVDVVANTAIHMIKYGAPGSNWIINAGQMEEAKLQEVYDLTKCFKD